MMRVYQAITCDMDEGQRVPRSRPHSPIENISGVLSAQRVFPASFAARSWMSTNALPSMAKSSPGKDATRRSGESQVMMGSAK